MLFMFPFSFDSLHCLQFEQVYLKLLSYIRYFMVLKSRHWEQLHIFCLFVLIPITMFSPRSLVTVTYTCCTMVNGYQTTPLLQMALFMLFLDLLEVKEVRIYANIIFFQIMPTMDVLHLMVPPCVPFLYCPGFLKVACF